MQLASNIIIIFFAPILTFIVCILSFFKRFVSFILEISKNYLLLQCYFVSSILDIIYDIFISRRRPESIGLRFGSNILSTLKGNDVVMNDDENRHLTEIRRNFIHVWNFQNFNK